MCVCARAHTTSGGLETAAVAAMPRGGAAAGGGFDALRNVGAAMGGGGARPQAQTQQQSDMMPNDMN